MRNTGTQFTCYGATDIGLSRKSNQDCFAVLEEEQFFALADGMGGHLAGEIASREAVTYLCRTIREVYSTLSNQLSPNNVQKLFDSIFQNVNQWVHHVGKSLEECQGMGTTLSSALLIDDQLITSHVGDSRIYRMRDEKIDLLTKDHTVINADPVKNVRRKILTQIIGSTHKVTPLTHIHTVHPSDLFLLCSDGLTDCVKENEICGIISSEYPIDKKVDQLIDLAKASGGSDNITAVMIEIEDFL